MVKYAIIRDDDINFFTSVDRLDKIYREIFALRVPVNLSVIPSVRTRIKIKNNPYSQHNGLKYEPFISEEYRSKNSFFDVCENSELIQFIDEMREHIEILQHGFSHSPSEFSSLNPIELEQNIITGKRLLRQAFGVTPKFFSAPYNDYSPLSISIVKKHFLGATFGAFTLRNAVSRRSLLKMPVSMMVRYLNALRIGETFFLSNKFLLLGHNGASINPFMDVDQFKEDFKKRFNEQQVITVMQHSWEYFYLKEQGCIGDKINKNLFDTFMDTVQWLKSKEVKFLTISQLYEKLQFQQRF